MSNITNLCEAIKSDDVSAVKTLLQNLNKNNINTRHENATPLFIAVSKTNVTKESMEIVKALLNAGADPNITNQHGMTPLFSASINGHAELITELLKKGADVNIQCNNLTPLYVAAASENIETVKTLLTHKEIDIERTLSISKERKDIDTIDIILKHKHTATVVSKENPDIITQFLEAIENNNIDTMNFILQNTPIQLLDKAIHKNNTKIINIVMNKVDTVTLLHKAIQNNNTRVIGTVLQKINVNATNDDGEALLHIAIKNKDANLFDELIKCITIDVNIKNKDSKTALHIAVENGQLPLVKKLLTNQRIYINAQDNHGETPLTIAIRMGYKEIAEQLLLHEQPTNTKHINLTALHIATLKRNIPAIKLLLQTMDPNVKTTNGLTALHIAAEMGDIRITEELLKYHADVNATDSNNTTALHIATLKGHKDVVKKLLEHRANVNSHDNNNITALHMAALTGNKQIATVLLQKGATIHAKDVNNKTPLDIAKQHNHDNIATTIQQFTITPKRKVISFAPKDKIISFTKTKKRLKRPPSTSSLT